MSKSISLSSSGERSKFQHYFTLTKPKVVALMLLTALVGMCLAVPAQLPLQQAVLGVLGIGLMASSAAAYNHLIDRRIDSLMARTYRRPLPSGDLSPVKVFLFASALAVVGFAILITGVNALTAYLTMASMLGYAVVYTLYLKRATPQNIVIAGIAGAMPPLLGWTAVTGELHSNAWLLVMIIFIWTPPHFWRWLSIAKKIMPKQTYPCCLSPTERNTPKPRFSCTPSCSRLFACFQCWLE